MDERNKAIFKSSFSMGQLDFDRYDILLKAMDKYSCLVNMGNPDALLPLYSVLKQIYNNFRPIIFDTQREKYEDKFKRLKSLISSQNASQMELKAYGKAFVNIDSNITSIIDELQMDLLEIKQIIGLGIQVDKQESNKTKLYRGLGIEHTEATQ